MPVLSLQNFVSWFSQIAVIGLAGTLLPKLFRVRHPRSHLTYCYLLLAGCIAVPFLQHIQHPAAAISKGIVPGSFGNSTARFASIATIVLVAGILARLGFFAAGLLRLRRYKATAVPLQFPKESILSICKLLERKVEIGVSTGEIGPVTLGWRRPTILLPDSFLSLDEEAQQAILCHELLHIARHDWLMHLLEEWIGAFLWFHPAIWLLLGQTKLVREQVVDSEVIRLTANPERYISALLAMAGAHPERGWVPAPQFFHRRHLAERVRLLLTDLSPSIVRLSSSYASITAILGFLFWAAVASFPLMGQSRSEGIASARAVQITGPTLALMPTTAMQPTDSGHPISLDGWQGVAYNIGNGVSAPRIITRVDPEYSDAARLARMEGTILVEGIVTTDGSFLSFNIVRSPAQQELNRSAILAVKQWKFEPGKLNGQPVPVRLVVEMSFNLK